MFDRRLPGSLQPCCTQSHGEVLDELRDGGIYAAEVRYPAAAALTKHVHATATLCILLGGGASERRGPGMVEQRALEVMTRAAHEPHENQYHGSGAHALVIELDPSAPAVRAALARPTARAPVTTHALGRHLIAAFRAPPSRRARAMSCAVGAALDQLTRTRDAPVPAWLEAAREILVERIADPPPLEELGRTLRVHPVYLAQAFRARWGATPRGFVRAHRVFRAVELIEGGTPLASAAAAVGFADQSHMTRTIAAARHATPGALRRAMR